MNYLIKKRSTKRHGIAFDLYYRWKGLKYRPHLGYNLSDEEAERRATTMVAEIQKQSEATLDTSSLTLLDLLPLFWDSFDNKRRVDRVRPAGILANHLLCCSSCRLHGNACRHRFGHQPVSLLSAEEGLRYVKDRLQEGASAGTVRREWQLLMRILNLAVRYDKLDRNRLKAVELPDASRRMRVAEQEELERIKTVIGRQQFNQQCIKELCRIILVALNTGLREAKIFSIERNWIRQRPDGYWLCLPAAATRTKGNPLEVPLNTAALAALHDELPALPEPKVFRHWKDIRAFKKYWDNTCQRAGIHDLHFHDLRHTFATRLQRLGVDYEVRQALLGHRMPGMTATYSHGGPEWDAKLREGVRRLEKAYPVAYGLAYGQAAATAGVAEPVDLSGEPPGTRTQGPRLKRAIRDDSDRVRSSAIKYVVLLETIGKWI